MSSDLTPRLLNQYVKEIVPELKKQFGYQNDLAVPRMSKIVLNIGCGQGAHDAKLLEAAQKTLTKITGQKPIVTRAKKSISNFKLREGDPIGCKVTLRRHRMYEFLDRLVSVVLPRVRDFRGLSLKGFDGQGNYNFGLDEQLVFPEIQMDEIPYTLGMNITLVTTAETDDEAKTLFYLLGFPLIRPAGAQAQPQAAGV